jgi:hypothetical protein
MSALALKEAYAAAEADADGVAVTRAAEVAFLTDHLGRWAGAFAGSLHAATPVPYYTRAAELLAAWVLAEVAALGAAPARLEGLADPGPAEKEAFTCPMADCASTDEEAAEEMA